MADIRSAYTDSVNFFGSCSPRELAERFGTPLYVYSEKILRKCCRELVSMCSVPGFGVNYSVKANSNPALLKIAREEGVTVDAMSPGELHMDLLAGFDADSILYISNNISPAEMRNAIDHKLLVSVDSLSQLDMYGRFNPGGKVMVRFNPGIGAGHHKKVITAGKETKFGVCPEDYDSVVALLAKYNLTLAGVNQHIGSLFMQADGYVQAAEVLLHLIDAMPESMRAAIEVIDFGGGFGIPYHKYENEPRLDLAALGAGLDALLGAWREKSGYSGRFLVEPGRYVAAECGLVLGSVEAVKNNGPRRYVGTDIGFNVLQRPVMYGSFHDVEIYGADQAERPVMEQTLVGNICESGDILAKERLWPEMREGDVVAMLDAGAYGFSMSSSYNTRCLAAEVLITEAGEARLIRRRQTLDDLTAALV
ncbi:MAG: diaminopimelate decarboxylase [Desulfovibrionaceae bacterium]|nr:diaminopimelate decarboxylase [Desulfovibrionaceae bacterium]